MAASNRSAQYTTLHKALKKAGFQPVLSDPQRPVLEQILFATCLENAAYEAAEEAYAALENNFIDWNEVRVTTVRELAEAFACLPDPETTADRVRRILQYVFESTYSFDLEPLRKQNLGPAVDELKKIDGATPFVVAYVTQSALGGHSIPIDQAAIRALFLLGVISAKNAESLSAPGLERAIAKTKGAEFGSLLHQFAARFSPHTSDEAVLAVARAVNPKAVDQWLAAGASQPPAVKKKASRSRGRKTAKASAPDAPPVDETEAKSTPKPGAKKAPKRSASKPKAEKAGPTEESGSSKQSSAKKAAAQTRKSSSPSKATKGTAKKPSQKVSKKKPR